MRDKVIKAAGDVLLGAGQQIVQELAGKGDANIHSGPASWGGEIGSRVVKLGAGKMRGGNGVVVPHFSERAPPPERAKYRDASADYRKKIKEGADVASSQKAKLMTAIGGQFDNDVVQELSGDKDLSHATMWKLKFDAAEVADMSRNVNFGVAEVIHQNRSRILDRR